MKERATGRPAARRLGLLLLVLWSASVNAAEYSAGLRLDTDFELNSNRRMQRGTPPSVFGATLDVETQFAVRTETAELRLTPLLRSIRYTGQEGLDSNDQYLDFTASQRTERLQLSLEVDLAHDSTLTSELLTTGSVPGNRRREEIALAPRLDYDFSDVLLGSAGYRYTTISYEKGLSVGLVDNDVHVADGTLVRRLSAADELFVTTFVSRFHLPQVDATTNSFGGSVGYARRFDETLSANFAIGGQVSTSEFRLLGRSAESAASGGLFDIGLQKELYRGSVAINAKKTLQPTSQGAVVNREEVEVSGLYRASERLDWRLNVFAFRNRSQGERARRRLDRDVLWLRFGLRHRVTRQLSLRANYRYMQRDSEGVTGTVHSNAIFLRLRFEADPTIVSR